MLGVSGAAWHSDTSNQILRLTSAIIIGLTKQSSRVANASKQNPLHQTTYYPGPTRFPLPRRQASRRFAS